MRGALPGRPPDPGTCRSRPTRARILRDTHRRLPPTPSTLGSVPACSRRQPAVLARRARQADFQEPRTAGFRSSPPHGPDLAAPISRSSPIRHPSRSCRCAADLPADAAAPASRRLLSSEARVLLLRHSAPDPIPARHARDRSPPRVRRNHAQPSPARFPAPRP